MDKNQKQQFWRMTLGGYTFGSLCEMISTYFNVLEVSYIRMTHIQLFCIVISLSWIWVKLSRQARSKKDVWKIRFLMIGTMLTEFYASQIIYRLIHEGTKDAVSALPIVILVGGGMIITFMIVWCLITDLIVKSSLKRINEKLSQNRNG